MTTAFGGIVSYYGGKKIHTFTTSGTLLVTVAGDVEMLMVAGGGGGGSSTGGGGGGGGVIYNAVQALPLTNITITIGAGGATNTRGGNTIISDGSVLLTTQTAIGGGRGGNGGGEDLSGGSGGGGRPGLGQAGGLGTAGQGNDGDGTGFGGGGGGGGGAGETATDENGGDGAAYSISGASAYYGAGGGAAGGAGGLGGGGAYDANGTGYGAAGGGNWTTGYQGIVIFSYSYSAAGRRRVQNEDMADEAQATLLGRAAAAGTGIPSGLTAAQVGTILSSIFQPLDSDLTTIAGLTPSDDDVIQRKAGSWTARTIAQLVTDIRVALDLIYVALTGDQTVAGVKSFSSVIVAGNHASSLGGEGDLEMFAPTGANPAVIQHAFGGVVGFVGMTADGTEASKSTVPSGKVLYNVAPYAYDGINYYADAHLKNVAAEAHDATHHGTKWEIWATPLASTTEQLIATIATPTAQYKYLISGAAPFAYAESAGGLNIASGKTPVFSNTLTFAGTDGETLTLTKGLTVTTNAGTLAFGAAGLTLTIPETGSAALLGTANVFTANQTISNTAPSLTLTDTTASAKSLKLSVDANVASFFEAAGAAGDILSLDLANKKVAIGATTQTQKLGVVGGTLNGIYAITDNAVSKYAIYGSGPAGVYGILGYRDAGGSYWGIYTNSNVYIAGSVGIGTSPNAAAILELSSTTKGFRLPNMTTTQRNAISSPPAGLMVYDITTDFIYRVNNAGSWLAL